jgi:two-component system NtrC family sensor kinase
MIITGIININQFRKAHRDEVRNHLEQTVLRHAESVDAFVNDRLSDIRVIARQYSREELSDPDFLRQLLVILREEYHGAFVDIGLVDGDGTQIAYAGPFNLNMADYGVADWFSEARLREHYISDVFAGLRGTPHFIVTAARSEDGERYFVKATIDFEAFNELVGNLRVGASGFAFIFNRDGAFQTKPRFEVALDQPPYAELATADATEDRVSIVQGEDMLGRRTIFATAPLRQGRWFLAYQQQVADAYQQLRHLETFAFIVFLIAAFVAVGVSYWLASQMSERVAEAERKESIMSDKVIETGKLASIGELAAGIAHEINNPVAIMVEEAGWIQDLLVTDHESSQQETEKEISRAVQQIRTQGERCKTITHKLLSFARKTDPTVRPFDLNDLVHEVIGLMGQKTRYANVKVETQLSPNLGPLYASPSELQQVLLNLFNNAVDAIGPDGGTVAVATERQGDEIALRVSDTGEGIPQANLERIFDPFFTTKAVGQGTGLGLSICYGIVDKLGGRISVESEVGAGTTFTIFFKAGKPDQATLDTVAAQSSEARGEAP